MRPSEHGLCRHTSRPEITVFASEPYNVSASGASALAATVLKRDPPVTELERRAREPETLESTPSSTGVIMRSWRARMIAFHRNSNFFHPIAYAKCFTRCLSVPCVNDASAIEDQR